MWNPIAKIKEFFIRRTIKKAIGEKNMEKVMGIIALLKGKKAYIIAFVGATVAMLDAFGVHVPVESIPESWWRILEFAGLAALRAGITKSNG